MVSQICMQCNMGIVAGRRLCPHGPVRSGVGFHGGLSEARLRLTPEFAYIQGMVHAPTGLCHAELEFPDAGNAVAACVLGQQVLRTDRSGMPLEWIDYREAVRLQFMGQVAYAFGTTLFRLRGGTNARSGQRTSVVVHSIVATVGHTRNPGARRHDYTPPLNNETLFKRDAHLCLYCGVRFQPQQLSRDHVRPFYLGGQDRWTNVVTACRRCNNHKANRTPEQAGLQLLAVPFTPTYAEYIYLKGRRVLADQMEYLRAHFPRSSPLHQREV